MKRLHITFFKNFAATSLTTAQMTLPELRDLILATSAPTKESLPWIKLARFGNKRSDHNSLRHNDNVFKISGCELDYDGEKRAFTTAVAILKTARVHSIVYTSPSHTQANPRWRILAPTSKELPPGHRGNLAARINGLFGGIFAGESFTLSQSYYFGAIKGNPAPRVEMISGSYIDQRHDLDRGAIGKPENEDSTAHQAAANNEPIDWDLIAAALENIPTEAAWVDYWVWLRIGAALFHEFGDDGFELFNWWSSNSSYYDAAGCARKWRECRKFTRITGATILFYANKAAPGWRPVYQAKLMRELFSFRTSK
jgi:hypothetical protein